MILSRAARPGHHRTWGPSTLPSPLPPARGACEGLVPPAHAMPGCEQGAAHTAMSDGASGFCNGAWGGGGSILRVQVIRPPSPVCRQPVRLQCCCISLHFRFHRRPHPTQTPQARLPPLQRGRLADLRCRPNAGREGRLASALQRRRSALILLLRQLALRCPGAAADAAAASVAAASPSPPQLPPFPGRAGAAPRSFGFRLRRRGAPYGSFAEPYYHTDHRP